MASIPDSARPAHPDTGGEVILGVDTHADQHVAALLTGVGAPVATASFAATAAGYRALLAWARGHGPVCTAGVEGTGSYGAALARYLRRAGVRVIEVNRPDRAARRRRGKTDPVDAEAAARAVLAGRATVTPKTADGPVETLRLLKLAKDSAVKARTQAINQLKAVLVGADPSLRESLAGMHRAALIRRCAQLPDPDPTASGDGVAATVVYTLRLLARRIQHLTGEINDLTRRISGVLTSHPPLCSNAAASARTAPPPCSSPPATTRSGSTMTHRLPRCAAPAPSRHPPERPADTGSTAAATGKPTQPSTASHSPGCAATREPATTSTAVPPKARPAARPSAASSATSPERSTH
jgi:Transposase